jgi:hypothetical protein
MDLELLFPALAPKPLPPRPLNSDDTTYAQDHSSTELPLIDRHGIDTTRRRPTAGDSTQNRITKEEETINNQSINTNQRPERPLRRERKKEKLVECVN